MKSPSTQEKPRSAQGNGKARSKHGEVPPCPSCLGTQFHEGY